MLENLLKSRKFWLAVLDVAVIAAKLLFPALPDAVFAAAVALLTTLIGAVTVDDAVKAKFANDQKLAKLRGEIR